MVDDQLVGLLGQGSIAAALVIIIWRVGNAMVQAIRDLRNEIAEHTKADIGALSQLTERLARIEVRMDVDVDVRDWQDGATTPPERPTGRTRAVARERKGTPIRGVPHIEGRYGPRKPGTEDE